MDGLEVLDKIQELSDVHCYDFCDGNIDTAVEAIKRGIRLYFKAA